MRLELPPGCTGIDGPGRRKVYKPREQGASVLIDDNPGYARALVEAGLRALPSKAIGFSSAPGWICECGRDNFAWASACSGCHREA